MENRKPLLSYLLINVAVSALTILLVLIIWNRILSPSKSPIPDSSAAPTAAPTALIDFSSSSDQLQITTIIGAGVVQSEFVLIEHVGNRDVMLAAWQLKDEDGNRFEFPGLVLHPGASLELFSRQGEDTVTRLFWNEESSIWNVGELASLLDPDGNLQATYLIP